MARAVSYSTKIEILPTRALILVSLVIITVELDSSEYKVSEADGNVSVCVQTDIGLPEPVDVQLKAFELLEKLNNATGKLV